MSTVKQRKAVKMKTILEGLQKQITKPNTSLWCYIYLVKSGDYYKIGYAFNVHSRVDSFKTANPHEVQLILAQKVPNAKKTEAKLHELFINKKYHREWYILDEEDVKFIEKSLMEELETNGK